MADSYWRYGDSRQPPSSAIPPIVGKRSRSDYDGPGSHDLPSYFPRDDDRGAMRGARDTESINASYDRYLRSTQVSSYGSGQPGRPLGGGMPGRTVDDPRLVGIGGIDPGTTVKDRPLGFSGGRPEVPLPPDASSTLFVEGLPANCTRREVARIFLLGSIILFGISFVLFSSPCAFFFQFVPSLVYTDIFRPFVGYKEVRLVSKESRHPGGDPLVLCFVDFLSPAHAATAMDALQGYKFDEHDRDSVNLRLQFARYPGARSGGGPRGKR